MRILVIGADREKVGLLAKDLRQHRYPVDLAFETSTGKYLFEKGAYHLIIVYHGCPTPDSRELCRMVRASGGSALLLMLASPGECSVFEAYSAGADCYLALPAESREIVARVNALARRSDGQPRPGSRITAGDLVMDLDSKEVNLRGKPINVTASEFRILQFMMEHKNRIVSREELADVIWGTRKPDGARRLPVHMNNLRGKLAKGAYDSSGIYTVSRRGYLMVDNNE
ncbi:MAG TPA: response regulator transcription factor [Puia sp.]|uniref:response regulator transcription factor n=1 Tax=Puia sp. TaxID=2045100 RepID=UPI002BF372B2|nr:response regulator transcription factor [Puia sp.]HVU99044.1 response regulator transcription factor [Puia sp.]